MVSELRGYMLEFLRPDVPLHLLEDYLQVAVSNSTLTPLLDLLDVYGKYPSKELRSVEHYYKLRAIVYPDPHKVITPTILIKFEDWDAALENLDAARRLHMNADQKSKDALKGAKHLAELREQQARLELRRAWRSFKDRQVESLMAVTK